MIPYAALQLSTVSDSLPILPSRPVAKHDRLLYRRQPLELGRCEIRVHPARGDLGNPLRPELDLAPTAQLEHDPVEDIVPLVAQQTVRGPDLGTVPVEHGRLVRHGEPGDLPLLLLLVRHLRSSACRRTLEPASARPRTRAPRRPGAREPVETSGCRAEPDAEPCNLSTSLHT